MTTTLIGKRVRYATLLKTFYRNPFVSMQTWNSINRFTNGPNVGSNRKKILIRFADLANIFVSIPDEISVLEFGSGSSSLFFLAHPKVKSLVSYEEKPEFLPKPAMRLRKTWTVVTDAFFEE